MFIHGSHHKREAKIFTSLIARRIGILNQNPDTILPLLDSVAGDISAAAADIAVIKLSISIIYHQEEKEFRHMLEGVLWLVPRCSLKIRNMLLKGGLSLDDSLALTQEKLISLQSKNFFYNNLLVCEIIGPMFSSIQEFNDIQEMHYLGDDIVATVNDIVNKYNALSLLSPKHSIHALITNVRKGIALKFQLANYLDEIKNLIKKAQEAKHSDLAVTDLQEAVAWLYKNENAVTDSEAGDFITDQYKVTFLANKKNNEVKPASIKRDVLRVLKKSPSATHY